MSTTTASPTELPTTKDVKDLLEALLGRSCDFAEATSTAGLDAASTHLVGTYVDDSLTLRAVVALDLAMAVYAGAAIGLMPPGGAQDCVDDGVLTPSHRDNAAEVLNIMASLFNTAGAAHLKLYGHHASGEAVPSDVQAVLSKRAGRVDWAVAVKGYGSGRLGIVLP